MKCKAIASTGSPCQKTASGSGYCSVHDPIKIQERNLIKARSAEKRKPLDEVITVVVEVALQHGWEYRIESIDESDFSFSEVILTKYISKNGFRFDHKSSLMILLEDGNVSFQLRGFSGGDYGESLLLSAIKGKLQKLNFTVAKKSEGSPKRDFETVGFLQDILKRFHVAAVQLLTRHDSRSTLSIGDEYDVQDFLHAILKIHFSDIRAEEYSPSKSGASTRIDFLLKNEKVLIEAKMMRASLSEKVLGEQIIIDKDRYKAHPDCVDVVFFVYDPEYLLKNPYGIENDLSEIQKEKRFHVFVYPK